MKLHSGGPGAQGNVSPYTIKVRYQISRCVVGKLILPCLTEKCTSEHHPQFQGFGSSGFYFGIAVAPGNPARTKLWAAKSQAAAKEVAGSAPSELVACSTSVSGTWLCTYGHLHIHIHVYTCASLLRPLLRCLPAIVQLLLS